MDLSIIVPTYNEESIIQENIKKIDETVKKFGYTYEIIVSDDGSTDSTYNKAKDTKKTIKNLKVVGYKENRGKGEAIINGFKNSSGKLVVFLDADLEIEPNEIERLIKKLNKEKSDVAIFSKNHPKSEINFPIYRKLLSVWYYMIVKILFRLPVRDTQTGCKLFKRKVLEKVIPRIATKKFAFDLELLVYAHSFGFKIVEAPVKIRLKREKVRINLNNILQMLIDTMKILNRIYF